jgi:hypothetical protein
LEKAAEEGAIWLKFEQLGEPLLTPCDRFFMKFTEGFVRMKGGKLGFKGRCECKDARVFIRVVIALNPIVDIKHLVGVNGAATVGLYDERFHRAKRVMIELNEGIVGAAIIGKYPPRFELLV